MAAESARSGGMPCALSIGTSGCKSTRGRSVSSLACCVGMVLRVSVRSVAPAEHMSALVLHGLE